MNHTFFLKKEFVSLRIVYFGRILFACRHLYSAFAMVVIHRHYFWLSMKRSLLEDKCIFPIPVYLCARFEAIPHSKVILISIIKWIRFVRMSHILLCMYFAQRPLSSAFSQSGVHMVSSTFVSCSVKLRLLEIPALTHDVGKAKYMHWKSSSYLKLDIYICMTPVPVQCASNSTRLLMLAV
jgi:hypothetical protein